MNTQTDLKNGFQQICAQREAMHSWVHLQTLLKHGSNREAAAIVESFQKQMQFEESETLSVAA
ncbi:MAG TPA: hypothetical protein V6C76_02960 [Drouetiella sp.]